MATQARKKAAKAIRKKAKTASGNKSTSAKTVGSRSQSKGPATDKSKRPRGAPILLSGGNPQIPKGDGDGPVQAYIAAMPGWKREVGRLLDDLIVSTVPDVCKAVKWNSPFYGVNGQGYFLGFHCLTKYVKVAFFSGASLSPLPPGSSRQKDVRYLDIYENDQLDRASLPVGSNRHRSCRVGCPEGPTWSCSHSYDCVRIRQA